MRPLTCCDKAFINGLHQGGMDIKDIAVKAKVGLSTVYTIIKAGYTGKPTLTVEKKEDVLQYSQKEGRGL